MNSTCAYPRVSIARSRLLTCLGFALATMLVGCNALSPRSATAPEGGTAHASVDSSGGIALLGLDVTWRRVGTSSVSLDTTISTESTGWVSVTSTILGGAGVDAPYVLVSAEGPEDSWSRLWPASIGPPGSVPTGPSPGSIEVTPRMSITRTVTISVPTDARFLKVEVRSFAFAAHPPRTSFPNNVQPQDIPPQFEETTGPRVEFRVPSD